MIQRWTRVSGASGCENSTKSARIKSCCLGDRSSRQHEIVKFLDYYVGKFDL